MTRIESMRIAVTLLLLASPANTVLACSCPAPPVTAGQRKPLNRAICNHLPRLGDDSAVSAIFRGRVREAHVDACKTLLLELPGGSLPQAEVVKILDAQLYCYVNGNDLRILSHAGGRFRFDLAPPSRYLVQVSRPGRQVLDAFSDDEEVELSPAR